MTTDVFPPAFLDHSLSLSKAKTTDFTFYNNQMTTSLWCHYTILRYEAK